MPIKKIHNHAYKKALEQTKEFKPYNYAKLYVAEFAKQNLHSTQSQAHAIISGIVKDYNRLNVIRKVSGLPELEEGQDPEPLMIVSNDLVNTLNLKLA
jgi:hypothetical protein